MKVISTCLIIRLLKLAKHEDFKIRGFFQSALIDQADKYLMHFAAHWRNIPHLVAKFDLITWKVRLPTLTTLAGPSR